MNELKNYDIMEKCTINKREEYCVFFILNTYEKLLAPSGVPCNFSYICSWKKMTGNSPVSFAEREMSPLIRGSELAPRSFATAATKSNQWPCTRSGGIRP
jgi:hypothetical protein